MQAAEDPILRAFEWLVERGVDSSRLSDLNPCVPGEFTLRNALYVNTGSPRVVYRGTEEGTLPLVTGRWYLIPNSLVDGHPELRLETAPVARARRLVG